MCMLRYGNASAFVCDEIVCVSVGVYLRMSDKITQTMNICLSVGVCVCFCAYIAFARMCQPEICARRPW